MIIDKKVPVPVPAGHIELAEKMNVGDSVFFEGVSSSRKCRFYLAVKEHCFTGRLDMKFSAKKQDDGVRVWRIK